MDPKDKKEKIYRTLESASEEKLDYVLEAISTYEKNEIVGYQPGGIPITQKNLEESLARAAKQIANGEGITSEELLEEIKTWRM